ncbi:unnamed protein product [Clonostachys rosea]|uniref:Ribosomal protein/NADH dehydrogenase domain-containing protein n=1 Tax=Bionectria ochroleuca TaxID=29856 RepID=A0ABY6TTW1_BIOOC|nr:unnamed protein product [Clonostachys rosea]
MRSLGIRWNKLRRRKSPIVRDSSLLTITQLIDLKCGPGAAILPPEVTRIHMDFAFKLNNGHMGPKKFWKEILPRIKYHNPAVPMIVNRHNNNDRPPVMTIYLRKPDASPTSDPAPVQPASSWADLSKATPPAADERVVTIDMKNKHSSAILEFFLAETRALTIAPTKEEIEEIQSLKVLKKESQISRARVLADRMAKKREEDMLKRARAAGGLAEAE